MLSHIISVWWATWSVHEDKKKDHEKILDEIIVEKFTKLVKEIITQVQETQRIPNRINPRRNTPRHILIKLMKIKHILQWFVHLPSESPKLQTDCIKKQRHCMRQLFRKPSKHWEHTQIPGWGKLTFPMVYIIFLIPVISKAESILLVMDMLNILIFR